MIPWFQWTTIQLGPLTIYVWGLFVSLGMLLSAYIITKRAKLAGESAETLLNILIAMVVSGVVFSRVFHVFFYEPSHFLSYPADIVKIWQGGLSSFGGLFGAALAFFISAKKKKWKMPAMLKIGDMMSFAAVFGWIVGRIGCFMIHDHLGAHSTCPWAIATPDGPRLDMALMEIIGMIPLGVLFFAMRKKKLPDGWYTGVLFLYYGVLRFILDFWRATDIANADARYAGLTPGQYFAILLVLCGSFLLVKMRKANKIKV